MIGDIPKYGRHSHTACEYKNKVLIFGGEERWNPTLNYRECLNDTRSFDPAKNEWKALRCLGGIDPRRNHAAAVVEKTMFVYGGINNQGTYLKDVWALNLSKKYELNI